MTRQLKFVLIFVFTLVMITPCCLAQIKDSNEDRLAFKSMHIFNLKAKYSADELQIDPHLSPFAVQNNMV